MRFKPYGYILLAGIVLLAALILLRSSETEKILQQLEDIRVLAEVHSAETALEQARKARQIGQAFSEQTRYDLTNAGHGIIDITSRKELVQNILRGRATLAALELAMDDPQVHIDGDTARVELQGSATGSSRGAQGQFLDIHTVEILLEKDQDGWLVTGARHIRDERQHDKPG
ncbi:MAG: nuclear transport factor 2 family protein [Gammaproteobacteria bacterium]|jgi:hypothetical protein